MTFTDLEKAFDRVDWKLLFRALKNSNLDWRDRRMILNLYKLQKTEIDINGYKKKAKIRRGVRQGCLLSPYLFNLFIEESITKMKDKTKGIRIHGMRIHYIRFADDIVIIGESAGEMENMLGTLSEALGKQIKNQQEENQNNLCREDKGECEG